MPPTVLIIDDNPDDRLLVLRELAQELPDLVPREVVDADDLARALETGEVVASVVDYQIRWTDGITVLRLLKARLPDAPVVMFTGSGNEEVAVAAMKAGLDDYVIKSPRNYARVAISVRQALAAATHKRALAEAEERLRRLFQGVPVGLVSTEPDGRILESNPAAAACLGCDAGDLVGVALGELFVDATCRQVVRDRLARGAGVERLECRVALRGAPTWAELRLTPTTSGGRVIRYEGVLQQIEDRKRTEAALQEHAERLAEQDRRKDAFLATLAHELRNPLAAITMAVGLLAWPDEARRARATATIDRQSKRLARMVDDLLDVSRIARDKIELRRQRLDLAEAIRGAVQASRPLMEQRRHAVETRLPAEPIWVDADAVRVEQVIWNLLDNAAKYTEPEGRIVIDLARVGADAVLRVRDSGVGIAPSFLPKVFDIFTQADRSVDRSKGGLGLGLAVVRGLVELHGGKVEARSEGPGRGSEFVVRLPAAAAPAAVDAPPLDEASVIPRRVLVVEDNEDIAGAIIELLRLEGHEVRHAADGLSGLELARSFTPDIGLFDVGLPGMDGHELARRLRAEGFRGPLVAMTGYGQDADRQRSREAGFDLHLTKPVAPETLSEIFRRFGAPRGTSAP